MRIIASRKDDLIKERDEWDAANKAQKAKHDAQYSKYRDTISDIVDAVKSDLLNALPNTSVELEVNVERWSEKGLTVSVSGNERRKFDDEVALAWSWEVYIDKQTGEPVKKSSSWSGLKAVTANQLQSLKDTVEILDRLNDIDWKTFLDIELPKYEDMVTERSNIGSRPDFESSIKEAELAELVGQNVAVRGKSSGRGYGAGVNVWYMLLKDSGTQYTVAELSDHDIDRAESTLEAFELEKKYAFRINKQKLADLISDPTDTLDLI